MSAYDDDEADIEIGKAQARARNRGCIDDGSNEIAKLKRRIKELEEEVYDLKHPLTAEEKEERAAKRMEDWARRYF